MRHAAIFPQQSRKRCKRKYATFFAQQAFFMQVSTVFVLILQDAQDFLFSPVQNLNFIFPTFEGKPYEAQNNLLPPFSIRDLLRC
jgi:hypothetical protein